MDVQFITKQTLLDADIDLTGEDVVALLVYLNEELQERVGTKITDALTDEQTKTMLDMQDTATEDELAQWMHENAPTMDALIETEIADLLEEISEPDDTEEE